MAFFAIWIKQKRMKWQKKSKGNSQRTNRAKLIDKLDKVFSLFIRLRDSQNGAFKCISCGQWKRFEQADCGHYVNRQHMALRYSEMNCNAQCRKCNRFMEGNIQGYRKGLIEKYGEPQVELLESMQNQTCKISEFELEQMIIFYTEKVKELQK